MFISSDRPAPIGSDSARTARSTRHTAARPTTTSRVRQLVRRLHLWLGLSVGLLFVLIGLTGSALVFYVEIDAALHPASRIEAERGPGWDSPVWDRALAAARAEWPGPAGSWSFEATGKGGAIPARYYPHAGHHGHHGHHAEREMVWFSPDGTQVVRHAPWGGYAMSWLYELHMHLLAGELGSQVVGWSGTVMLLLLVSGIAAWWPRGRWRKALAFKQDAAPIRRLRDLHKLFGLWSAGLLLVLVGTGVLLALPNVKALLLAPDSVPDPTSSRVDGRQIPIVQALAAAHRALPAARLAFIDVPGHGDGAIRMRVQVPGDPHRRFPSSFIFVDQYSGKVLAVHDERRGTSGTRLGAWIRCLHDGSVGGLPVRILAVLLGLVPAILFVTGFLHWRRRRRAARPQATAKAHFGSNIS
ncbi:PepSY domain-containing protein [Sphingosinicella sp. BN140058]|uniref:PepSY-associated TM helix domain-containing protein n=1 Tax=Sphingosinicella sp. BN140058 TaxID=1892855 RepID=UPI001010D4A5|nr:PepSY-associated TM helix domain-containing protein [Sphingosinicella sp. BN140058]QAY77548.1 PepSY domain-containing protein [Sphingosinicella sp. BN140058]